MNRWIRLAAAAAVLSWLVAVVGFGRALEGYSQRVDPVALLGAHGVPHAFAFNVFGFVLPGLLLATVAWRVRRCMSDHVPWAARIGARLALLSALAFAAQGLLPMDPRDVEAAASHAHATAWMLWWVALLPAALLLAIGLRQDPPRRVLALASLAVFVLVGCLVMLPLQLLVPAVAERVVLIAWLAWGMLAAWKAVD